MSEVLHLFSLIQSSTKGVFLRTRDYANYRIKQNHCGGDKGVSEEFDWGFGMSYPGFRIAPEFAGFQISVYLGDGGNIDWDEVVVPYGLKVVDEREMSNADNAPQQTEKERK
ncbi:MAG: hypothetical protein KC964_27795 [Candidatus Omnitrophica bacterium]|nr:hypothetical protein [Candidatus Omnitrophota bacterium]